MLFFSIDGSLIEINRHDYKNDKLYYIKIMEQLKSRDLMNYLLNIVDKRESLLS